MSGDEVLALVVSIAIALFGWGRWYFHLLRLRVIGSHRRIRLLLGVVPLLCGCVLFVILQRFASSDVRDSGAYLSFYLIMGAAWVTLFSIFSPLLGISVRFDAIERRNPAAAIAVCGRLVGMTLCFAGANISDGPGWWVVVFSAVLSTGSLLLLWTLIQTLANLSDAITIDRDIATGLRLAGFLTAAGLILGRAVAGDWISPEQTIHDFIRVGWEVVPLTAIAVIFERAFEPSPSNPEPSAFFVGLIPSLSYIGAAVVAVIEVGRW